MKETTKLSWGPECGPDRGWIEEQFRLAGEAMKVRKLAKVDARESGSGYAEAEGSEAVADATGYPGDLWSGLDDARDRGEG